MRAETIRNRLEGFVNSCTDNQDLGAYIRVLDDISLADAYFVSRDGETYTCSCECGTTVTIEKTPTKEVQTFAEQIFEEGEYTQIRGTDKKGVTLLYAGIPVKEEGVTTAVVVIVDTLDIDQSSFRLSMMILLGCLMASFVVAIVLANIMAKRFMVPIHKIAHATTELANGNYQVKTEVYDKNEIGELAKKTDILAEQLNQASKERERLKQVQRDYIANISHELRTPVTVIRSSMEALHDGVVPEEKVEEYQKQMLSETISLQRLVNDMLELSRLENEDFPIEKEELDLGMVLEDAVRSIRMIARDKQIQVHFSGAMEEWPFEGDYGRLKQMFLAVLDNAVKYSEPVSDVWIETVRKADNYYVSIKDEGCGIPEEAIGNIFEKFYRSSNNAVAGTGLGMAVTKSIAQRHKINVRVQSVVGRETKFTFIAPAHK